MVEITVKKDGSFYSSVKISGHTGFAEHGQDIVCAGISTVVQTALLGLLKVAKIDVDYSFDEPNGQLEFTLPKKLTEQQQNDAKIILDTMLVGVEDFLTEYNEFITLEVI